MITSALFVFLVGTIDEAACVGFVHFSERKNAFATAGCSMLAAGCLMTGAFETVHNWTRGIAFVLGVGTGAFVGVLAKRLRKKVDKPRDPVPMVLICPKCGKNHVDRDEWATTRIHRSHLCENCGHVWRPFEFATVGIEPSRLTTLLLEHGLADVKAGCVSPVPAHVFEESDDE